MPFETGGEPLSTENTGSPAVCCFGGLKLQRVFESHDMSGIHHIFSIDLDGVHGPECVEEHRSCSTAADPENPLTAEQGVSKTRPGGIDIDIRSRAQPGRALNDQGLALEGVQVDLPNQFGTQNQFRNHPDGR